MTALGPEDPDESERRYYMALSLAFLSFIAFVTVTLNMSGGRL